MGSAVSVSQTKVFVYACETALSNKYYLFGFYAIYMCKTSRPLYNKIIQLQKWRRDTVCKMRSCTHCKDNTENSKQIFPEKKFRGLSPDFHIHVPLGDLYILPIGLPIIVQENT